MPGEITVYALTRTDWMFFFRLYAMVVETAGRARLLPSRKRRNPWPYMLFSRVHGSAGASPSRSVHKLDGAAFFLMLLTRKRCSGLAVLIAATEHSVLLATPSEICVCHRSCTSPGRTFVFAQHAFWLISWQANQFEGPLHYHDESGKRPNSRVSLGQREQRGSTIGACDWYRQVRLAGAAAGSDGAGDAESFLNRDSEGFLHVDLSTAGAPKRIASKRLTPQQPVMEMAHPAVTSKVRF